MLFGGSMQRTKKNHGFTLIELMITIAVMAIIAMLAAPSFADLIAKQRLESTTKQLLNILTTARSQAILLRQATTVNLDSSNPDTGTVLNWKPNQAILKSATYKPVFFTENGLIAQEVANPDHVSDPLQPAKIKAPAAAVFVICGERIITPPQIREIRTISVMVTGNIESVVASTGSCS